MKPLREIWEELAGRYTDDTRYIDECRAEIEKHYAAPNRHYHNLQHLAYMTGKAMDFGGLLSDPDTVLFAIFYHDIVYDPARRDNEEKSAGLAGVRLARLGVPGEKIARCRQQIMATKTHKDPADKDTAYLLDFDLAILGEPPPVYQDYTQQIRAEYAIYPDFLYRGGRKKVLRHFLDGDSIFKTEVFRQRYERQARENMLEEMNRLG